MENYKITFKSEDDICTTESDFQLEGFGSVLNDHYDTRLFVHFERDLEDAITSGKDFRIGFDSSYLVFDGQDRIRFLAEYGSSPVCEMSLTTMYSVYEKWKKWVEGAYKVRQFQSLKLNVSLVKVLPRDIIDL